MLQTKWQSDLFNLFDIEARILSSKEVLKYLEQTQVSQIPLLLALSQA